MICINPLSIEWPDSPKKNGSATVDQLSYDLALLQSQQKQFHPTTSLCESIVLFFQSETSFCDVLCFKASKLRQKAPDISAFHSSFAEGTPAWYFRHHRISEAPPDLADSTGTTRAATRAATRVTRATIPHATGIHWPNPMCQVVPKTSTNPTPKPNMQLLNWQVA